jgi:hypothetical protein
MKKIKSIFGRAATPLAAAARNGVRALPLASLLLCAFALNANADTDFIDFWLNYMSAIPVGGPATNLNALTIYGLLPTNTLPGDLARLSTSNAAGLTNFTVTVTNTPNLTVDTNLTVSNNATIDGNLTAGPSGELTVNSFGATLANGGAFSGAGSGIVDLSASQLSTGTVPLAVLPTNVATVSSNLYYGNAIGLTNLQIAGLTNGTLSTNQMPAGLAIWVQHMTGTPTIATNFGGISNVIIHNTGDISMTITTVFTNGPSGAGTELFTGTFATPWPAPPVCTPGGGISTSFNDNFSPARTFVVTTTATTFSVYLNGATAPATTDTYTNYFTFAP